MINTEGPLEAVDRKQVTATVYTHFTKLPILELVVDRWRLEEVRQVCFPKLRIYALCTSGDREVVRSDSVDSVDPCEAIETEGETVSRVCQNDNLTCHDFHEFFEVECARSISVDLLDDHVQLLRGQCIIQFVKNIPEDVSCDISVSFSVIKTECFP